MIEFTEEQKRILSYEKGVMAIPSVPGSGKTFILTHLALKLHRKIPKDKKILLLTYMNSSVETFYGKLKTIDKNIENIQIKTIHKFCLDLIKENLTYFNLSENFLLLDNLSSAKLVEDIYKIWFAENKLKFNQFFCEDIKNSEEDFYTSLKFCCLNTISKAKNFGLTYDKIEKEKVKEPLLELAIDFYKSYEKRLNQLNYIDYDDILLKSYNFLNENEWYLGDYRSRFFYILEDESQDSNYLQNKIVNLLSNNNLVKVGDSNQNITGSFSNSSPAIFRKFGKKAPIKIELDLSFRSSNSIVHLANFFIKYVKLSHTTKELNKALNPPFIKTFSDNSENFGIKNYLTKDLNEEFILCVKKIKAFNKKFPDKTIGILVPRNKHINVLGNLLKKEDLDFEILSDFSQNNLETYEKLADILAFIQNPNNKNTLIKLMEKHFFKNSFDEEDKKTIYNSTVEDLFLQNNIEKFKKIFEKLHLLLEFSLNTKEKTLIYISQNFEFDKIEQEIIENIALNLKLIFKFNPKWSYKDLIIELKKVENNKLNYFNWGLSKKNLKNKSISITTYHKSKGKEWDLVYLLSLNEEFFPVFLHKEQQGEKKYLKENYRILEAVTFYELEKILKGDFYKNPILDFKRKKIEESLRVIYVGITRAKDYLIISSNLENEGVFYYKLFKKLINKQKKDS